MGSSCYPLGLASPVLRRLELEAHGLRWAHAPRRILVLTVWLSGAISALFVNDTACILLTPLVLETALSMRRNPLPYLLAVAMGSNLGTSPAGLPLDSVAAGIASQLQGMPGSAQESQLRQIEATQPELSELVKQHMRPQGVSGGGKNGVDMRPMPTQKPPRRLSLGGAGG